MGRWHRGDRADLLRGWRGAEVGLGRFQRASTHVGGSVVRTNGEAKLLHAVGARTGSFWRCDSTPERCEHQWQGWRGEGQIQEME